MEVESLKTTDSELFQPEEQRLLDKTVAIREDIVDNMIKDGLPVKTNEIRVINELLNSIDGNVLGKVDRRLKYTEETNNNDMRELVKSIILQGEKIKSEIKPIELDETLPDEHSLGNGELTELVPGEDSFEYEEISLEELK